MLIPKEAVSAKAFFPDSNIWLESGHICIKKEIADLLFGTETTILSAFYENSFVVAPGSSGFFKRIYDASQQMLKTKNAAGDKSISIQEILLDNDINDKNRNLQFTIKGRLHILKVIL